MEDMQRPTRSRSRNQKVETKTLESLHPIWKLIIEVRFANPTPMLTAATYSELALDLFSCLK